MTDPSLNQALEQLLDKSNRQLLCRAAEQLSQRYRRSEEGRVYPTSMALRSREEYLAYLAVRQPATAAVANYVLRVLASLLPQQWQWGRVLDAGSGPGTALWQASHWFSWKEATAFEIDRNWIELAKQLWRYHEAPLPLCWQRGNLARDELPEADLVIACYSLNELDNPQQIARRLWKSTRQLLVWIEPGRLDCFEQLQAFRQQLLEDPDAWIVAPCTASGPCPYSQIDTFPEVGPGWCHFSVRLERSRLHRELKQATLGYEDEKFSYLIVARRSQCQGLVLGDSRRATRVMQDPMVRSGHVRLALCDSEQLIEQVITKSEPERYRAAKRLRWGDSWSQ